MIKIVKWWDKFENAGSKKLKTCSYFSAPSGNDSKGYRKLMRKGAEGVIALGVFQAICQVMPTLSQDARKNGSLWNSDGSPMDLDDILDLTRLPEEVLSPALLLLESIGWIDRDGEAENPCEIKEVPSPADNLPTESHRPPTESQDDPNGEEGRVEEGRVEERIPPNPPKGEPAKPEVSDFESDFVEKWNQHTSNSAIASIRKRIPERCRRAWNARRKDAEWRESWEQALLFAVCQPFNLGQNDRGWVMDVEWFLRPHTVAKALAQSQAKATNREHAIEPDIGGRTMSVTKASDLPKSQTQQEEIPI